jgi:outer membrane receptor for ferrienterochelin and colicins
MKTILIVIALLCSVNIAYASEPEKTSPAAAILEGKIESMGDFVPFATVYLKGTSIGTSSDANGIFKLTNIPAGQHTIIFSAIGYKPLQKLHTFQTGEHIKLMVEMETDHIGIEQVVISSNRNAQSRRDAASIVNSINPNLFERMQSVTLSEGLNFTPGLRMENNCQNCGFSQVRMNGLEGPYVQILINSRPVFSGLAGVYGLELIPVNMIERVEVIRGGGSAMFGSNAIAGTVNLITKDPVSNSFSLSSSYGLTGMEMQNSGAQSDYNLNFNSSLVSEDYQSGLSIYGFHRQRNPFDANNDTYSELSSIANSTMGARVFQRTGNRGKFSLDYFNINEYRRGGNRFDLPLHEADIAESTTHKINSASVTFDQLFKETDKISAWISAVGVDRGSYYGANQDLSAYGQTDDISVSAGGQYVRNFNDFVFAPATIIFGAEWNYNHLNDEKKGYYDYESGIHVGNTEVADQRINSGAAFMQSEWNLQPFMLTAGIRLDSYHIDDLLWKSERVSGNVFSPRISILYHANENLQFRTAYASGFRAPQIFDEDLHIETSGARKVLHRNAANLKQETSESFTASLNFSNQTLHWQYQFLVEGFITLLKNPFSNEYGIPDENGLVIYTRMNAEDGAIVQGVNLEFNASPSRRLQLQSGFTFQKSTFEKPQEFEEKRFFRSPSRYGFASLNYSPGSGFSLSATGSYTGPMLVPYFGPRAENPGNGVLLTSPSFCDAGIKLSYDIPISKTVKMQINTGVRNIFNSYQNDFDMGINRDPAYIYGPASPRSIYFGLKFGSF